MTIIYVDSNAGGANDGTSWTDAYTDLASTTGAAAGDEILIEYRHSQTVAANTTLNFSNGTLHNPVRLYSVDKDNSDALRTGATYNLSTAAYYTMTWQGSLYIYGVTQGGGYRQIFQPGAGKQQEWDNCTWVYSKDSGSFELGNAYEPSSMIMRGCTLTCSTGFLSSAGSFRQRGVHVDWINCTFGGTVSAGQALLDSFGGDVKTITTFRDCDISIFDTLMKSPCEGLVHIVRCKIHASLATGTNNYDNGVILKIEQSDDGTVTDPVLAPTQFWWFKGHTIKTSLSRYRTGGADDGEQANAYSWEMATSSSALEVYSTLESPPLVAWVAPDATPSGATARGLFQSTRMTPRGTPAALTTDSTSTWNGTGVGTKQKITATIGDYTVTVYVASGATLNNDDFWIEVSAPDQVGGPVTVRCFLAKPSTTVYVDPKLEIA